MDVENILLMTSKGTTVFYGIPRGQIGSSMKEEMSNFLNSLNLQWMGFTRFVGHVGIELTLWRPPL